MPLPGSLRTPLSAVFGLLTAGSSKSSSLINAKQQNETEKLISPDGGALSEKADFRIEGMTCGACVEVSRPPFSVISVCFERMGCVYGDVTWPTRVRHGRCKMIQLFVGRQWVPVGKLPVHRPGFAISYFFERKSTECHPLAMQCCSAGFPAPNCIPNRDHRHADYVY